MSLVVTYTNLPVSAVTQLRTRKMWYLPLGTLDGIQFVAVRSIEILFSVFLRNSSRNVEFTSSFSLLLQ